MKLTRFAGNPIFTPGDKTWENKAVFNCAVIDWQGSLHLVYRAMGDDKISRFGMAKLKGLNEIAERRPEPVFAPDPDSGYENLGVEDPRITKIGDVYWMMYVAASKYPTLMEIPVHPREAEWRVRVCLAKTSDFESWSRYGVVISHIDSKDAALFPEKIEGNYLLVHRVLPQLRLAVAPDGRNYKERGPLFGPRSGMWDDDRVGVGAPPLKSPYGWIMFYHGMDSKHVYRLGIALLDADDPSLVLARTTEPILEPQEEYERSGEVNNVVFTCGAAETSDQYAVYYAGGDRVICLATIDKNEVWNWAKEESAKSQFHQFHQVGNVTTTETAERQQGISDI